MPKKVHRGSSIGCRVSEKTRTQLEIIAAGRGVSLSDVITDALRSLISNEGHSVERAISPVDFFAAHALSGLIARGKEYPPPHADERFRYDAVTEAYQFAIVMMDLRGDFNDE